MRETGNVEILGEKPQGHKPTGRIRHGIVNEIKMPQYRPQL
jgi:hypothetical protein